MDEANTLVDRESPATGDGFYYLVKPGGTCEAGSWQTDSGEQPERDASLP